jgi:hypothetical protein
MGNFPREAFDGILDLMGLVTPKNALDRLQASIGVSPP